MVKFPRQTTDGIRVSYVSPSQSVTGQSAQTFFRRYEHTMLPHASGLNSGGNSGGSSAIYAHVGFEMDGVGIGCDEPLWTAIGNGRRDKGNANYTCQTNVTTEIVIHSQNFLIHQTDGQQSSLLSCSFSMNVFSFAAKIQQMIHLFIWRNWESGRPYW